jgi:Spy/CpxP family protein refolding chaperone
MKAKVLIIILIISLGINVGTVIRVIQHKHYMETFDREDLFPPPQNRRDRFPPPPKPDLQNSILSRALKLSDKQVNKIEEMHLNTGSKIDPIAQALDLKRKELISLLKEDKLDEVKVDTLFKQISVLQSKIEFYLFENMCQMKEILTPAQQQQFFELLQKGLLDKGHPHGPGPGPQYGLEPEHGPGNEHQHGPMCPPDGPGPDKFPQGN